MLDDILGGVPEVPDLGALPLNLSQEIENTVQPIENAVENTAAARIGNIQMISVQSSDIAAWGYDPLNNQLQIQFTNNRIYVYDGISPMDFEMLSTAPSKGRMFWELIRKNPVSHPFTRLS